MKKSMYKIAGFGVICLAFALHGFAQDDTKPTQPAPPAAVTIPSVIDQQSEIIIRQKGDKDSKVTIEIRNGDYYINGKPLDKFDDKNIEIEKRIINEDMDPMRVYVSPFRGNAWDQERIKMDQERMRMDQEEQNMAQKAFRKSFTIRSNEAFLGVASRKAESGGATILEVTPFSPAEKAGLKKGDIILKVNDQKIASPDNLFETVHQFKPGDKIKITFKREGKEQSVSAVLEKSKKEAKTYNYKYNFNMPDMSNLPGLESPVWGPMPPKIGIKAQDSEDSKGVNVLEVVEGSAAEKAGLKKGDIITSFDGAEVNTANELIQRVRDSREKSTVKVKILRSGKPQDIEIKVPRKLKTAEL